MKLTTKDITIVKSNNVDFSHIVDWRCSHRSFTNVGEYKIGKRLLSNILKHVSEEAECLHLDISKYPYIEIDCLYDSPTVYFYQTEDLRGSYIQLGEIFHRYGIIRQACFSIKT